MPDDETARHADLVCALHLGIGELRRAAREATLSGPKLESSIELAVEIMVPGYFLACSK